MTLTTNDSIRLKKKLYKDILKFVKQKLQQSQGPGKGRSIPLYVAFCI